MRERDVFPQGHQSGEPIDLGPLGPEPRRRPRAEPYDPERDREGIRAHIAKTAIWLLVGIVGLSFLTAWFCEPQTVKDLLPLVFSPIVGLVGAVTGFYFGERRRERADA